MGRSRGPGSPAFFHCAAYRRSWDADRRLDDHVVTLTGRTKPFSPPVRGMRSTDTSREYRCSCGHVGWSAHVDLARRAAT